jgi:hypothetical protein
MGAMCPRVSKSKWMARLRAALLVTLLGLGAGQPPLRAAAAPTTAAQPQSPPCNNLLGDGDFEALMSPWDEAYPDLQPPLRAPAPIAFCDSGACDVAPAQAPAGPLNGKWWAWFGGGITDTMPIQSVMQTISQTVALPAGQSASLAFSFWISRADAGTDASDVLRIALGNTPVFTATALDGPAYPVYRPVRLNLSALANGQPAVFTVSATTRAAQNVQPPVVNFNVDALQLCSPGVWPVYLPFVKK